MLFHLFLLLHRLNLAELTTGVVSPQAKVVMPTEDLILIKEVEWPPNDPSHLWDWVSSMSAKEDCSVLALFNKKPPRISILDAKTLELVTTFGRKGKGPGEFVDFAAWIGFKDDTLFVSQGHRTSLFTSDGKYLHDIRTFRTNPAILSVNWSTGIDQDGNVYYWNARPNSDYLIVKRMRDGREELLVSSSDIRSTHRLQREEMNIYCGVVKDGSIIIALAKRPIVARYTRTGSRVWSVDLLKEVPVLQGTYREVQKGKILALYSTFWVDETYVILTFANAELRVGKPRIYYLFLDTRTGSVVRLTYASQNIRGPRPNQEDFDERLYNPWAVAHCDGKLYVFSVNSARVQMYRMAWHK